MQLRAAAEEAQTLPGTGLDRLRAFLRSYADVNMRDFGKSVIRTGEEALAPESAERLREMKREIDAALRNLVRAGIEDKSIAAGDVRSEEPTSELQSLMRISYAVFCLKQKNKQKI